jgi:hypothetical protein
VKKKNKKKARIFAPIFSPRRFACLSLFFHSHAQMLNILFLPCFRLSSLLVVCVLLRSSVLRSSSRRKPGEGAKMR